MSFDDFDPTVRRLIRGTSYNVGFACPKCWRPVNYVHHESDCDLAAEFAAEFNSAAGENRYRDDTLAAHGLAWLAPVSRSTINMVVG